MDGRRTATHRIPGVDAPASANTATSRSGARWSEASTLRPHRIAIHGSRANTSTSRQARSTIARYRGPMGPCRREARNDHAASLAWLASTRLRPTACRSKAAVATRKRSAPCGGHLERRRNMPAGGRGLPGCRRQPLESRSRSSRFSQRRKCHDACAPAPRGNHVGDTTRARPTPASQASVATQKAAAAKTGGRGARHPVRPGRPPAASRSSRGAVRPRWRHGCAGRHRPDATLGFRKP